MAIKPTPETLVPVLIISDILIGGKHTGEGTIVTMKFGDAQYLAACNKVMMGDRQTLEREAKRLEKTAVAA